METVDNHANQNTEYFGWQFLISNKIPNVIPNSLKFHYTTDY